MKKIFKTIFLLSLITILFPRTSFATTSTPSLKVGGQQAIVSDLEPFPKNSTKPELLSLIYVLPYVPFIPYPIYINHSVNSHGYNYTGVLKRNGPGYLRIQGTPVRCIVYMGCFYPR